MHEASSLPTTIGEGKMREVTPVWEDTWRKLVVIRLRAGALLDDHSTKFPITIHAFLGSGTLRVAGREYPLTPGVVVPVDAHVIHSVQADPEIAILVTFFRHAGAATVSAS